VTDLLCCRAEAIAWPLVSLDAFRHASPLIHREVLSSSFRLRLQQLGLERDEELAQWAWNDSKPVYMHLQDHASKLLYGNGSCMRLQPDHASPGREILAWRWYSLALPPLLLTSAAMSPGDPAPNWVQVLDPTIRPHGPIAHLHLHLGAAYPFELVWSSMASTVEFDEIRDLPIGMHDEKEWQGWLRRALLTRRVLNDHARHYSALAECSACLSWLDDSDVEHALGELATGYQKDYDKVRERSLARLARDPRFERRTIQRVSDVWYNDPIGGEELLPEAAFMCVSYSARPSQAL
jgi:hypothetical protein